MFAKRRGPHPAWPGPAGEWWLEVCRFFSAGDVGRLASERAQSIPLPIGFDKRSELLRGIERLHYPAGDVAGACSA